MGETITVEGTVVRTHNSGNAVFLNFSADNQEVFTAVIFPDDWPKFPAPPETLFYGKLVRIEGIIEAYQGTPEIIIKDPWQIEVALTLGQPVVSNCDCQAAQALQPPTVTPTVPMFAVETPPVAIEPTAVPVEAATVPIEAVATTAPTAAAAPPAGGTVISWAEAAAYEGQTVTVEGRVVDTYNSGKVALLNFDPDFRTTFKVAIFPDVWPLFPAPPEEYYRDKLVRVTGQIKMYQNAPEIVVERPDQIEIVE
jgi:DNA/RNA endonuclease YhcR with UshA esterase domain